jgi:hypothetical protein
LYRYVKDIGVKGGRPSGGDDDDGDDDGVPLLVLYYNYPAEEFADPLLMAGFTECKSRFLGLEGDEAGAGAGGAVVGAGLGAGAVKKTAGPAGTPHRGGGPVQVEVS